MMTGCTFVVCSLSSNIPSSPPALAGTISAGCYLMLRVFGQVLFSFDIEDSSVMDLDLGLLINCKMDFISLFLYTRNSLVIWSKNWLSNYDTCITVSLSHSKRSFCRATWEHVCSRHTHALNSSKKKTKKNLSIVDNIENCLNLWSSIISHLQKDYKFSKLLLSLRQFTFPQ